MGKAAFGRNVVGTRGVAFKKKEAEAEGNPGRGFAGGTWAPIVIGGLLRRIKDKKIGGRLFDPPL